MGRGNGINSEVFNVSPSYMDDCILMQLHFFREANRVFGYHCKGRLMLGMVESLSGGQYRTAALL